MQDLKIENKGSDVDLVYENGELQSDDIRNSAILNQLLTDASTTKEEAELYGVAKADGWLLGDYGSKLHLLSRSKSIPSIQTLAQSFIVEALDFVDKIDIDSILKDNKLTVSGLLEVGKVADFDTLQTTRDSILRNTKAALEDAELGTTAVDDIRITDNLFKRGMLYVISQSLAPAFFLLSNMIERLKKSSFVITSEGEDLEKHGETFLVLRKDATPAKLVLRFSGNNGVEIPAGTEIQGDQSYVTDAASSIAGNSFVDVNVTAKESGVDSLVRVGNIFYIVNKIVGVEDEVEVIGITSRGSSRETDQEFKNRIIEKQSQSVTGGTIRDYEAWTKEITGISRAFIFRAFDPSNIEDTGERNRGGVVGIMAVNDDNEDSQHTEDQRSAIIANLEKDDRPAAPLFFVFNPFAIKHNVTISNLLVTSQNALIKSALEDFFKRNGNPRSQILTSSITNVINNVLGGGINFNLVTPVTTISTGVYQVSLLGVLTINGVAVL